MPSHSPASRRGRITLSTARALHAHGLANWSRPHGVIKSVLAVNEQFPEQAKAKELNADQHEQNREEQQGAVSDGSSRENLLRGQRETDESTGGQRHHPRQTEHVHRPLPILREKRDR